MVGRILGGRYQIQHRVGSGGMATVYRAVDTYLNRPVAVKILRPEFAGDEDFVRRFRREARAAASLSHPNVVAVYDVGREGDDTYYIIMEYVDGPTLKEYIREGGPLPAHEAVRIAGEILEALEHAHQMGVVHRDVKPQNVLLTRGGHAKVADFGIARATTGASATHTATVVGTAHYVSPEQARGQAADERSDVYSTAVVLYEMLTGRVPFEGEIPVAVALKHVRDEPLPPRAINPSVPAALERVVLRAMAKDPAQRYPSAGAFRRELIAAANGRSTLPDSPAPADPAHAEPEPDQPTLVVGRPPRRRLGTLWRQVAVLTVLTVLLAGSGALAYWGVGRWLRVPTVDVPDVRGMSLVEAQRRLTAAGLLPVVVATRYSNTVPVNSVIDESPTPGTPVKAGRRVELTVSSGPDWVPGGVPDVAGQAARQAELNLENAGLRWVEVHRYDDRVPRDHVVDTEPPAGSSVTVGTTVRIMISDGPEPQPFALPDWTGQPLADVQAAIRAQGLKVGSVTQRPGSYPQGAVLDTNPKPGAVVRPGDSVDLVVSSGCEHAAVLTISIPATYTAPVSVEVFAVDTFTPRHRIYQGVRPPGSQIPVNVCWSGPEARWDATANGAPLASGVLP